ncbi:Ig-like domain-containing protein [Vibrio campbellii]|uniref:Ig-like domain-containing protein n=1 Tax=Vibrio campbellii TaxID=680 RepID=UPI0005EF2AB3|nr:Ig-like domain-containing protein [Vibrio campbellii]
MKISTSIKSTILTLLAVVGLSACNHGVKELVVTPKENSVPLGFQLQLKAEKVSKKGKVTDVTISDDVEWRSSDESVATVDQNGLVSTGDITGIVEITAIGTFNGKKYEDTVIVEVTEAVVTSITVTPKDASTPVGLTRSYTATANFSNGQAIDVTQDSSTSWDSSDFYVATISNDEENKGQVKAKAVGTSTITAYIDVDGERFSDSAILNVTEAIAVSLEITPKIQSVSVGLTEQFSAIVTMSDGTKLDVTNEKSIDWSSREPDVATVSNEVGSKGLVTGVDTGWTTIAVSGQVNGEFVNASASLQVIRAVITSLEVTPETETVPAGLAKPFKAFATLSSGEVIDVTNDSAISWSSSDSKIATISNSEVDKGTATGVAMGEVTITAFVEANGEEITDTAKLLVTEAVMVHLDVTPKPQESLDTPQIPSGMTKQFKAEVVMSDGTRIDVTTADNLYWSSDDPMIATVSNGAGEKGLATGVDVGDVFITARLLSDGYTVEDHALLTVTEPHSVSLVVFTEKSENTVQGEDVHYIGYSRNIMGRYWVLSGANHLNGPMQYIYIEGIEGKPIEDQKFFFGNKKAEPISGSLRYKANFTWPDNSKTDGILEWNFEEKVYVLTDPTVVENLLKYEADFTLVVSNEGEF